MILSYSLLKYVDKGWHQYYLITVNTQFIAYFIMKASSAALSFRSNEMLHISSKRNVKILSLQIKVRIIPNVNVIKSARRQCLRAAY